MTREEEIQDSLIKKFNFLENKIRVQRQKRIFAEVPSENFLEIFEYAVEDLGFKFICTITGLDEGSSLAFIYHITRQDGITLNLKITVPKEHPVIKTVMQFFPGADIYEREVMDLLGAKVEGLPAGKRYPLPDDWPAGQYPLRKDWKKPEKAKGKEETQNA